MVMRMEQGLDTGPVCLGEQVPIGADATAGEMQDVLAQLGASLMVRALAALERGSLDCTPQSSDGVTYAKKIDKAEARIDFAKDAREVHNLIRGLSPFPGAWFEAGADGKRERIKVLRSVVADGQRSAGQRARRSAHRRLRRGSRAPRRAAARRQEADVGGGGLAWLPAAARHADRR